ncbi:MAG: M20/M25/M40 family metallo-hydrolase, partial [Oscillospiraceae bacterium]
TVLGGDDKAGVCAILEALHTIVENRLPHPTIEIVLTVREESGLLGSKAVDFSRFLAREAFVLDSSGDVGTVMVGAPGQIKLLATVIGKAAHAGVAPEQGVSAIWVAAKGVAEMKLLRIDEETTANIGTFTAVGPTNIVSDKVMIEAEIRSRNTEKLYAQADHMARCLQDACERFHARLELSQQVSYLGYHHSEDAPLLHRVSGACRAIGVECVFALSGGGSDANVMNQNGIHAVNLAVGMEKVHTTQEQISLQNLERAAALVLELMTRQEG